VDLIDFAPAATYLPTIIETQDWVSTREIRLATRPVVLHIPTNAFLKGSYLIDPILQKLHQQGVITYLRLEGIEPTLMPHYINQADIVVDQCVLGLYSVMAIQAMAAERIAIAHIPNRVRERVPVAGLPVIDATANELEMKVLEVIANAESFEAIAKTGPQFVAELHNGAKSAAALQPFLNGSVI